MISKKIFLLFLAVISCNTALAETEVNNGPNIYVPDYRLEKIYQAPEGDIYAVRGSFRRMDNFVELWARIIPRDKEQKTLETWKSEKMPLNPEAAYAHINLHFYCSGDQAAIPATYLFDIENELISSLVMTMDEMFSTDNRPIMKQIKKMACGGKLERLSDTRGENNS